MGFVTKDGFAFSFDPAACEQCDGRCCTGEAGHVWVTDKEVKAICTFLDVERSLFVRDYLRKINGRRSLKEVSVNGQLECLFLDSKSRRCIIYAVRPAQCRSYPFWDCFKENAEAAVAECPAVRPLPDA